MRQSSSPFIKEAAFNILPEEISSIELNKTVSLDSYA